MIEPVPRTLTPHSTPPGPPRPVPSTVTVPLPPALIRPPRYTLTPSASASPKPVIDTSPPARPPPRGYPLPRRGRPPPRRVLDTPPRADVIIEPASPTSPPLLVSWPRAPPRPTMRVRAVPPEMRPPSAAHTPT